MERETGIEPATFSFGRWPSRIVQQRMFGQLATTAHSTRNLVTASVQRCAAQHPGRRAAETVCRQFQYPRLRFSRRHLRQIWLSWRHGLPLGTEIWGGEDAEFEPRCLRRTWRLSRFWLTTWKRSPSVSPSGTSFGSLHRRLRQQTVLRRLNTKHPPGKGPFAVRAAPVLSPWLPSVAPGSRGGGVLVSGAVRHVPPACSCAAGRPGEVSAPGLAVLLGPWWLPPWRGCGDPPGCCFPRSPSILHPTGAGAAQATPATTRRTLPPRKAPRKPGPVLLPPLPGRSGVTGILVSVTPDGAAPASNGRQRRPCRDRKSVV